MLPSISSLLFIDRNPRIFSVHPVDTLSHFWRNIRVFFSSKNLFVQILVKSLFSFWATEIVLKFANFSPNFMNVSFQMSANVASLWHCCAIFSQNTVRFQKGTPTVWCCFTKFLNMKWASMFSTKNWWVSDNRNLAPGSQPNSEYLFFPQNKLFFV